VINEQEHGPGFYELNYEMYRNEPDGLDYPKSLAWLERAAE
jgi:hypothetical protein